MWVPKESTEDRGWGKEWGVAALLCPDCCEGVTDTEDDERVTIAKAGESAAAAFEAMKQVDHKEALRFVDEVHNIQALVRPDSDGHTLLHRASNLHMARVVQSILQKKNVPLDFVTGSKPTGSTALMMACQRHDKGGKVETIKALLDARADHGITNAKLFTALHYAAAQGDEQTVKQATISFVGIVLLFHL